MKYQSIILENNTLSIDEIFSIISQKKNIIINKFQTNIIETDKPSIGISELSDLSSWAYLKNEDGIKLTLIKDAEKMTLEAQNSILKLLEEPPENTLIVLQTQNADSFLDTIISRCEKIDYKDKVLDNKELRLGVEDLFKSNFLERQEIFARFLESRIELTQLFEAILKFGIENDFDSKFLEFVEYAIEAVSKNVNVKLIVNNLNIEIEDFNKL